jgi:uncharacterized sporulation protein YeaH/YhbH (DUF444 family)
MQIVDRRLNPGGKSLANRQRFLRRAKDMVREAVRNSAGERSMKDLERGGEVTIPASGVKEPHFRRSAGGVREHVLPGNKEYLEATPSPARAAAVAEATRAARTGRGRTASASR